ncbi:hypothetical protein ACTI_82430 [Actinoplanes sp. OR16]|uniref:hypothetical protein n=1 Tax=Actinoplanes sp. OR16 TaxID=946334 RepID=UPI000F6C34E4|nr:hypothetical protein [Actinoplanes sp. OR16]BBH71558.1 hypothetical protein ACTI_82430 [Actinoplanes sp. OR16]
MRTGAKLAAYATGLIAIFGVSAGAGAAIGPDGTPPAAEPAHTGTAAHDEPAGHAEPTAHAEPTGHGEPTATASGDHGGGHGSGGSELPGGLQISQDGYRLETITTALSTGAAEPFAFRIRDEHGATVTDYTVSHEKELHLIVVRRDLAHYQHVHPVRDADGTWTVPLRVGAAGQYRVFADFETGGHDLTLGADVPAPGDYQPRPLPHSAKTTTAGGYQVTYDGDFLKGDVSFTVTKDGKQITTEPYLGARGHLVALREGDLAYLHVHPTDPDGLAFHAEVPSAGVYRLYLDFQHDGKVHTAEFTADTGHTHQ